ncbi:MAG: amino acid permease [Candidatus Bathyarchaeia archaeon]|jgi:amino acid transporter
MSDKGDPKLTLFDVTNLVVGAIIGADIYVASSFGAAYLGPSSLLVWAAAGVVAIIIALCFAQCAAYLPRVGGPYAYAKEAWGIFPGFIVGWSLWLAEWISLAVFPVAFLRYLSFFQPNIDPVFQVLIKTLFVTFLILTNILGVKAAGRTNDALTIIKLAPLILFVVAGVGYILLNPTTAVENLTPFAPFGYTSFGFTLVLVFWAYAGFEISTIPADVVENPGRVIPRAIVLGMTIVTVFYLATNFVLFAVRTSPQLATDLAPLASATSSILGTNSLLAILGGLVVSVGALISVAGSDESGMIGTSRLGYALAVDGLFPKIFAKIHPKYKTPYLAIIIQAATALIASLIGNLGTLVAVSVFFLAIAYAATCASILYFRRRDPEPAFRLKGGILIPILGVIFSIYLITQCTTSQIAIGLILLGLGVPMYIVFTPKKELTILKEELIAPGALKEETMKLKERFLAHAISHLKELFGHKE